MAFITSDKIVTLSKNKNFGKLLSATMSLIVSKYVNSFLRSLVILTNVICFYIIIKCVNIGRISA